MKRIQKILGIALVLFFFFASCEKDNTQKIVHGNITLKVLVKHHNWVIHNLNVYLKSNSDSFPGQDTSLYDSWTQTSQDGYCQFSNLYPGNYYLYAEGYDPAVDTSVLGYAPVVITSQGNANNTVSFTLYVSE